MELHLHVSDNPFDELASDLVRVLAELAEPNIALSGGDTPRALFHLLNDPEYHGKIDWSKTGIWQVDERGVGPDHPDSNWRMISGELLSEITPRRAERIRAEEKGAAEAYEALIREGVPAGPGGIPRFDVVILGMGDDGHFASLFPGTAALDETERLIVRNDIPQKNDYRITMTYPLVRAAARRWFLVRGAGKARAFARVREGGLPAGQLNDTHWYISREVVRQ